MPRRSATVRALALATLIGVGPTSARADSPFESIGVGAGFAMPTPGLSLFARRDDRWSGTATLGVGAELRVNHEREGSRGGYWTGGAARLPGVLTLVRGGYGRAWQRGPWRWHLEATLNLPVYIDDGGADDAYVSLGNVAVAAYTVLIPIGFGVHYTFD